MGHMNNVALRRILLILAAVVAITGCANFETTTLPTPCRRVPDDGKLPEKGYLAIEALPDSIALLPPPPVSGSAALALDEEVSRKNLDLQDTPRWEQAKEDADLNYVRAADTFSCMLKVPINKQDTPKLYELLRKVAADASNSTKGAKEKYKRPRPFRTNKKPICTPCDENYLKGNGSYPSGHTAIGWAWALILTEIVPEQTDVILTRGRAFGESRIVCNVHWQSDVTEGRLMGTAVIARLHADSKFIKDVEDVRKELMAVRAKGLKLQRNCEVETKALVH
jgi:acid phosphatase (class A)